MCKRINTNDEKEKESTIIYLFEIKRKARILPVHQAPLSLLTLNKSISSSSSASSAWHSLLAAPFCSSNSRSPLSCGLSSLACFLSTEIVYSGTMSKE